MSVRIIVIKISLLQNYNIPGSLARYVFILSCHSGGKRLCCYFSGIMFKFVLS